MFGIIRKKEKGEQYIHAVSAASTTESTEILETMTSTLIFGRRVLSTGTAQGHGLIGGKAQGRAAVEAEHQAEADEPVAGRADAKIHHIFHEDIAGVLSAGEACLAEREAGLHEVDEERSHERPTGVDGAEHNADTSPHILPPGASPAAHTHPAAASLYLRSSAENPEKEALYLSLGRRGQASPGNTKGADRIFIRQRLCFRWQKYRAVWSKCQEQNAIFDILHKPKKKGQRKLWQTSFFLGVARPHLDMEQQAHQRP